MLTRMRGTVATAALLAGAVTLVPAGPARAASSVVKVTGSQGNWQLTVNGSPYVVKGVTWGTDGSSARLFAAAGANNIKVVAGFWLQPGGGPGSGGCTNYVADTTYKNNMLAEFTKWVQTYRDNPAVLMWNVGNESVLGLQNCSSGTELENQRNAYTGFVNDVAKAIHRMDANHPVISTDAWVGAWTYYKRNSPDLDLYAVKRAYGGDTAGDHLPPTASVPSVADPGAVPAGKEITVQAPATDPEGDQLAYEVLWGGKYVDGGGGLVSAPSTNPGNGTLKVTAPAKTGAWKLYVKAKDGRGNVGVEQHSVKVVPPPVSGTNVALNRPTTASTFQNDGYGGCPCGISASGRYVRLELNQRGTGYGYSLFRFGVYA
ncbi:hypothetical protein [Streptomyces sp. NBC_01244]|uniref:hypothetical protein n=1 Tax=Streptomyces sp. NBC_01244 TaxID=2903797 RepID=UPI002E140D14|nr:hypothetical protein OG247_05775 [Streptomyces sp. NBC_01244]